MNAVADSSVIIAAMAEWHEFHEVAKQSLSEIEIAIPHTLAEVFSALTRMPNQFRFNAQQVIQFIDAVFKTELGGLSHLQSIRELHRLGITGGAIFDGLIGISARDHGFELVTLDQRATRTYIAIGVSYLLLN